MPTVKLVEDGTEIQIVDVTRPLAQHNYHCAWCQREPKQWELGKIEKGRRYVRVVYKLKGKFESDHICLDCWCGPEANGEATSS